MVLEELVTWLSGVISQKIFTEIGIVLLYTAIGFIFFLFLVIALSFFFNNETINSFFHRQNRYAKYVFWIFVVYIFLSLSISVILSKITVLTASSISLLLYLLTFSILIALITQEIGTHFILGDSTFLYKTIISFLATLLLFSSAPTLYNLDIPSTIRLSISMVVIICLFIKFEVVKKTCKMSLNFVYYLLERTEKTRVNKKGYIDPRTIIWILIVLLILYILSKNHIL
jgi:hypothetical protein